MRMFYGAALAALAVATSAAAVVNVSSVNGPDSGVPAGQTVIYDFDSTVPVAGVDITGDYGIVSGSLANVYAAPLGDVTNYLTVPLASAPGSATLNLNGGFTALSFYWGSIDTYNSVEFLDGDGNSLGVVTSANIPPAPANGAQGDALNNRRVSFNFGGDRASTLVLTSRDYAFELDTISGAVPEPSTWAMLIVGMGLVGSSMRRRRSVTTVAA